VSIFGRDGAIVDVIPLTNRCTSMDWDASGKFLAVLQTGLSSFLVWDFSNRLPHTISIGKKDPTFVKWSLQGDTLAVGTVGGEVIFWSRKSRNQTICQAGQRKRIVCGDWNIRNRFASASDNRHISITTIEGKMRGQLRVKSRPTCVKFGRADGLRENVLSVCVDKKSILLYDLDDDKALELAFQQRYGDIVGFQWLERGRLMVGFSNGYLVVISTHPEEIGREQFCTRLQSPISAISHHCSSSTQGGADSSGFGSSFGYGFGSCNKVATCGGFIVNVVNVDEDSSSWTVDVTHDLKDMGGGTLESVQWSRDGRAFSVGSSTGSLYLFVSEDPATEGGIDAGLSDGFLAVLSRPLSKRSVLASTFASIVLSVLVAASVLDVGVSDVVRLVLWANQSI